MIIKNLVYAFCFFALLFTTTTSFCQEKAILITKKDSSTTVFLKENKRIKVKLANNKTFFGRLKIENDSTFSINGNSISLDSIVNIKRKSLALTIINPLIIYYGVSFTGVGIVLAIYGYTEIGILIFGGGTAMILTPLISDKHPSNNWTYKIVENPLNKLKK